MNKVELTGTLVKQPNSFETRKGCLTRFTVCSVSEQGGKATKAFVNVVCFDGLAATAKTLKKGTSVKVSGALSTKPFEKNGIRYCKVQIRANSISLKK